MKKAPSLSYIVWTILLAGLFVGCAKEEPPATPEAPAPVAEAPAPAPAPKVEAPAAPETPAPPPPTDGKGAGSAAAVVPGADLICTIDVSALSATPMAKKLQAMRKDGDDAPEGPTKLERIRELTGLTGEDVETIQLSVDLENVELGGTKGYEAVQRAPAAVAIRLVRPLPEDQLPEVLRILSAQSQRARTEVVTLAGRNVARVVPSSAREPTVHAAVSRSGRSVFVAFNEESMTGLLERDTSGRPEAVNPALAAVEKSLPDGSQVRLLMLASEAMRARLHKQFNEAKAAQEQAGGPDMSIIFTFLGPLRNIRNLAFGMKLADDAELRLSGQLANAQEAQQCAHLLQTFLVPMLQKLAEQQPEADMAAIFQSLRITNEGAALLVSMRMTEDDLARQ